MNPAQPIPNERLFHPDASIVLVGCRGAGKRTLGFIGATYLRRRLITEDHFFEATTGLSRAAFLERHGKEAFARRTAEVLVLMLHSNRAGCVIETGMGSLLSPESRVALAEFARTNPVVYVHRERERIADLLALGVDEADRLMRADAGHRDCSNLEYYNLFNGPEEGSTAATLGGGSAAPPDAANHMLLRAREDFERFLDFVTGQGTTRAWLESPFSIRAVPPEHRAYSYALRLRLSCFMTLGFDLEDLQARADAVELIVDTWPEDILTVLARTVAQIRRKVALPIIFHVEENPREEAKRPQDVRDDVDTRLLLQGLRLGVEYISVDLDRNPELVSAVMRRRGRSKVMGNFWYNGLGAPPWSHQVHIDNYMRAQTLGCSLVRMVRFSTGDSEPEHLDAFRGHLEAALAATTALSAAGGAHQHHHQQSRPVLVAYDFSVLGARTPLQSRVLAPVRHSAMRPTGREALATVCTCSSSFGNLFRSSQLDALQFYTLGSDVAYSVSPAMHRAAYEFSGMPHAFEAVTCGSLEQLMKICSGAVFGGASLTAPFKEAVMPFLALTSKHARAIGAVNTVLPLRGASSSILDHVNSRNKAGIPQGLYGDNTDWSSIASCLRRTLSPRNHVQPGTTTCLVVGAGGMARAAVYALVQLGARRIFIWNRTRDRAEKVAAHFNSWWAASASAGNGSGSGGGGGSGETICRVIPSLDDPWPEGFEMPTIVVSCVPASSTAPDEPPANFTMPLPWLRSRTGGVVVEVG